MTNFGLLIFAGVLAGILAGFFGVGGGVILVPFLIFFFGYDHHAASGTSLVALLPPVGLLGIIAYYKAGKIGMDNIKAGLVITIGMFLGTYFGARLATPLPADYLKKIFAVFNLLLAIKFWFF